MFDFNDYEIKNFETLIDLSLTLKNFLEELFIISNRLEKSLPFESQQNIKKAEECLLSISVAIDELSKVEQKLKKLLTQDKPKKKQSKNKQSKNNQNASHKKKVHECFLLLLSYIRLRIFFAKILAKKANCTANSTSFLKILKNKEFIDQESPSLIDLYGDLLSLRWNVLCKFEKVILNEVYKDKRKIIVHKEKLQTAKIAALEVIDSLKFPKAQKVLRALKSALEKERTKEENYVNSSYEARKSIDLLFEEDNTNNLEDAFEIFLFKKGANEYFSQEDNSDFQNSFLSRLSVDSCFWEGKNFLEGKTRLSLYIKGGFRFLLNYIKASEENVYVPSKV